MEPAAGLSDGYAPSMLRHMLCLPRPKSMFFRLMLALALIAWTALAFGSPSMAEANGMQASQSQAQVTNATMHCPDTMMASDGSHGLSTPMPRTGHGDCCQTACHCLAASTVLMTVPWIFVAFIPSGEHWSAGPQVPVPPALAARPLRPPIA